jgi:hypothetical protein
MKFTEWMKLKEFQQATPMGQARPPMATQSPSTQPAQAIRPNMTKKDTTVDNVRSIVMKAKDPKIAQKQISQLYDTQMSASKDAAEIAKIAAKKSSTLSALQGS